MELTKAQQKGAELMQTLIQKAWDNPEFKNQLISDPVATIESEAGVKMDIPAGRNVIVDDQSNSNHIYLNIPRDILNHDTELVNEELDTISGGLANGCSIRKAGIAAGDAFVDALHDFGDWIDDTFTE